MPTPSILPPDPEDELAAYWITDELQDAYYLALGRFIDAYGRTESTLAHYLTRFAAREFGDDSERGRALARSLLGALRTEGLKDTMTKAAATAGIEQRFQEELSGALAHLGEIRFLRDRIVHAGALPEFHDGKWTVRTTNHNQVRVEAQIVEIHFTIEDLDAATTDLESIAIRIRHALFTTLRKIGEATRAYRRAHEPWQYRPSGLKKRSPNATPRKPSTRAK
jgi:hypothetical protein